MGMVPEAPIAMLACARLGAPHTVVFGGFSADSLSDRLHDMGCEVLITQDEAWRRGTTVPLKRTADEALAELAGRARTSLVLRRTGNDVPMTGGPRPLVARARDRRHARARPSRWTPRTCSTCSTRPARPRSRRASRTRPAGYLVGVATTHHYVFDLKPETDVYWCAADVGWVTGHSYIVYGPLCNGATSVMYEGTPDFPDKDRWWEIVERYGVTILYTAPTAIRAHMKWGPEHAQKHDLSSLRLLGSVGEPINPEAWVWYHEHIGGEPLPDRRHVVADGDRDDHDHAAAGRHDDEARLGDAAVPRRRRRRLQRGGRGGRAGRRRLPRAAPAVARDAARDLRRRRSATARRTGRSTRDVYFAGDGARIDEDGDFWLLGRVDDVMNVSGHRISTIEVESALVDHQRRRRGRGRRAQRRD